MRRPRFTIANLLVFVLFLGVGLAALREATDIWDGGIFGVTLAVLLISVLLAIHRAGVGRAYWLGFALFGWSYLVLSLMPPIEPRLPTSKALVYLDSKVSDRPARFMVAFSSAGPGGGAGKPMQALAFSVDGQAVATNGGTSVRLWSVTGKLLAGPNGTSENFVRIGHSLLALLLAFFGAHISRHLHASGQPGRDGETEVDLSKMSSPTTNGSSTHDESEDHDEQHSEP